MMNQNQISLINKIIPEFGRPLGVLLSITQSLLNGAAKQDDLREYMLQGMESELQGLRQLLDNLAVYQVIYDNQVKLTKEHTNFNHWLIRKLTPWAAVARQKSIIWHVSFESELPDLFIDSEKLLLIISNLIDNAIKATPPHGTISIKTTKNDRGISFSVEDDGRGIAEKDQPLIFDPFYRVLVHDYFPKGLGLGLTVVQYLVQLHQGKIFVESEPGKGSTFTVWLPYS